MQNPQLVRYWFKTKKGHGIGVTAYSLVDAENLIASANPFVNKEVLEVIENVDVQSLDQGHVIPNMGPPNVRGVWYPMLNL
jgi:hypothetical protein